LSPHQQNLAFEPVWSFGFGLAKIRSPRNQKITVMKSLVLIPILSLLSLTGYTQSSMQTQTIKGTVLDLNSKYPLIGVNIVLVDSDPFIGTVTDENGQFKMENVPAGRQALMVKFIGYKTQVIPNVLVTTGKEVVVNIQLEESVENLKEVVITPDADKDRPINEMAKVSARTFDIEEVQRFSGGRNDVARLATYLAGVRAADDARNDIIVRGNSPTGVLWRIDGLPIATTNHFSTLGTTGGPVNALNTNVLRTSDFLTGAFPAEYGNANAAVFDVNFRNGNTENHEFLFQASAFSGLEGMAEGPISKKNQSSYLVAYRYGIASLAATGTSSVPRYQDLSFKINLGQSKLGVFELYGMGGTSNIDFLGDEIEEDDLFADPTQDAFVTNQLGLVGLNHNIRIDKTSYLKTTIGATLVGNTFNQDNFLYDDSGDKIGRYRATEVDNTENRYTISTQYNKKFSPRFNLRAGGMVQVYHLQSQSRDRDMNVDIPDDNDDGIPDYFIVSRDIDEYTPLIEVYAQGEYKFSDELSWNFGLHNQYAEFNGSNAIEPRTGLSWQFKPNQRLSAAYGLHSQLVPLPILVYEEPNENGVNERTNANLDFMKSHHFVLAYDYKFAQNWRLKAEAYYQRLFSAPIEQVSSSYSVLNEGADFTFNERGSLVSEGNGDNYGIELTIEKFFSKGYYFLLTTSLYESTYAGSDGVTRSTAFNNNYAVNALFGKEWPIGKSKRTALTFDTRLTTTGGTPYTPIDLEATRANGGTEVYFEDQAFSERYDPYFRWDVKFGVRLNSKNSKVSHQLFLDLQNVTNRENVFVDRYNPVTDEINTVTQAGFFPDFMYRFQF
jgi:hypothetical protein